MPNNVDLIFFNKHNFFCLVRRLCNTSPYLFYNLKTHVRITHTKCETKKIMFINLLQSTLFCINDERVYTNTVVVIIYSSL